jgi:N-dimethylarginine dimethylaminohydrolase
MPDIPPVPFSGLPDALDAKPPSMSGVVYLTRCVSSGFAAAQRIEADGTLLDASLAQKEHDAFVEVLRARGGPLATVIEIPSDPDQPDCVFVEDTHVVLPGRGVFQCATHDSRAGEIAPVSEVVTSVAFEFPASTIVRDGIADASLGERIEGGDVQYVRGGDDTYHHYLVGVGNRSNRKGAEALRRALRNSLEREKNSEAFKKKRNGVDDEAPELSETQYFVVHEIDMTVDRSWLHLKSALTWAPYVGFVTTSATCPIYEQCRMALESYESTATNLLKDAPTVVGRKNCPQGAANVLSVPGGILFCHPDAAVEVKKKGGDMVEVVVVDQPELARADGALTCGVLVIDPFFNWTGFS